jgi:hypothetical protein
MTKIFTLLIALVLFIACKNDNNLQFHLKGIVINSITNTTISGGKVSVYSTPANSNVPKFEGSATITANGDYSISVDRDQYTSLQLHVEKEGYFKEIKTVLFAELKATEDNIFNLTTSARSWIRFNIKNANNPSSSDEFKFLKSAGKQGCSGCCENGFTFLYGALDTNITCINDGGSYFSYYYWVNGNEVFGSDSVITPAFDTLIVSIEY